MTTSVLITKQPDDRYTARALVLPDVVASGATEQEAVEQLKAALATLRTHSHVVQVDLPLPGETADNPWLHFSGLWEHDPDWDAFQEAVAAYRQETDARFSPA